MITTIWPLSANLMIPEHKATVKFTEKPSNDDTFSSVSDQNNHVSGLVHVF